MALAAQSIDCPPKADASAGRRVAGTRRHAMAAAGTAGLIAANAAAVAIHRAGRLKNPPCPG